MYASHTRVSLSLSKAGLRDASPFDKLRVTLQAAAQEIRV